MTWCSRSQSIDSKKRQNTFFSGAACLACCLHPQSLPFITAHMASSFLLLFLFLTSLMASQVSGARTVTRTRVVRVDVKCEDESCNVMRLKYDGFTSTRLRRLMTRRFGEGRLYIECKFFIQDQSQEDLTVAFVSQCQGRTGEARFQGAILMPRRQHHLEYSVGQRRQKLTVITLTNEYRSLGQDDEGQQPFCGTPDADTVDQDEPEHPATLMPESRAASSETRAEGVIELLMAVDFDALTAFNGDRVKVEMLMYTLLNGMRALLQSMHLRVQLLKLLFVDEKATKWCQSETEKRSPADMYYEYTLHQVRWYEGHVFDAHHLFPASERLKGSPDAIVTLIGRRWSDDSLMGKARQSQACHRLASCVVLLPHNATRAMPDVALLAVTATHEVAHVLGLLHYDQCPTCMSPNGECIMSAHASFKDGHWSKCARDKMHQVIRWEKPCLTQININNTDPSYDPEWLWSE